MKKCPFCAEEIQDAAIKCRYCGSLLTQAAPQPVEEPLGAAPTSASAAMFKVCSSCGQQVREVDPRCWNCKSDEFQPTRTAGTPATISQMNDPAAAQPTAESKGFWAKVAANAENKKWGKVNTAIICPQCQTKGQVRTLPTKRKAGISGAKATGAVLTLGWSMLATGLSRKQQVTQAHCDNCNSTWDF